MKRTRKVARSASASIQDEISKMADDLASLGSTLGENASTETKATMRSLRRRFDNVADDASAMADETIESAEKTITENPFIALGAAFGLGAVISAILLRR